MLRVVVHEFTSRFTIRIGRARYGRLAHTTPLEDRQPRVGHASEGHFAASRISIRHLDPRRAEPDQRGGPPLLASCRPLVRRGKGRSGVRDAAPVPPIARTRTTEKAAGPNQTYASGGRGRLSHVSHLDSRPGRSIRLYRDSTDVNQPDRARTGRWVRQDKGKLEIEALASDAGPRCSRVSLEGAVEVRNRPARTPFRGRNHQRDRRSVASTWRIVRLGINGTPSWSRNR